MSGLGRETAPAIDGNMSRSKQLAALTLLILACLPLLLFVYLGLHTRMIHDDFGVAAIGRELGAWGGFVHYYNNWSGAYFSIPLRTGLAEFALALPPLVALMSIGIWLLGLYWLARQLLPVFDRQKTAALGLSALTVAAAINAFYSPDSLYLYSANVQYTVPLACLCVCLALALRTLQRSENRASLLRGAAACALISFLTAGASEMFLVFQLIFLLLLAPVAAMLVDRRHRPGLAVVAAAMLIATTIGLIIQLSSPGIWNRMASDAIAYDPPIRSLPLLLETTVQYTYGSIGRPPVFAGFTLLLAAGMFLALLRVSAAERSARPAIAQRANLAWLVGLSVQIVFLPIVWSQRSDNPQFLSRYSLAYLAVIITHSVLLLGFLLAYWRREKLRLILESHEHALAAASSALAALFLLLFAMTQVRHIDARASTYLFVSALSLLIVLAMLWQPVPPGSAGSKLAALALASTLIGWATIAALVGVTFLGHGFFAPRIMAGAAFLQVTSGLIWGWFLGTLIRSQGGQLSSWRRWLGAACLTVAIALGGAVFLGQARLVTDFQTYAREWDARDQSIRAQRDGGRQQITVAPLTFDLADHIGMGSLRYAERFYQVESIEIVDS